MNYSKKLFATLFILIGLNVAQQVRAITFAPITFKELVQSAASFHWDQLRFAATHWKLVGGTLAAYMAYQAISSKFAKNREKELKQLKVKIDNNIALLELLRYSDNIKKNNHGLTLKNGSNLIFKNNALDKLASLKKLLRLISNDIKTYYSNYWYQSLPELIRNFLSPKSLVAADRLKKYSKLDEFNDEQTMDIASLIQVIKQELDLEKLNFIERIMHKHTTAKINA